MSLNGDDITGSLDQGIGVPLTMGSVVGPAEEFNFVGGQFRVDFEDDSFTITVGTTIPFFPYSLEFSGLDWVDDPNGFITGVSPSGNPGVTTSFDAHSITIDFAPLSISNGDEFTFDITTECFLSGTRILTDRGEINVEDLTIGDLVQTADGFQPIKWIGKQTVDPTRVKSALRSHPICVKSGALGDNLPQRDLYLSPDHALLVDGLLINAGALVNGTSILKTEPTETFTYYHVELDIHALMVVEGTYAESYLPQKEDRHCYDNSDEFDALYPNQCNMILWPLDYPRVSSMTTVPRYIRKRLNAVADELLATELHAVIESQTQNKHEEELQLA